MDPVRGREVTEGMSRFGTDRIDWYVLEDGDALTVVDVGPPGHREQLVEEVEGPGHRLAAIEAILVTHGALDELVYRPGWGGSDARASSAVARPGECGGGGATTMR